MTTITNIVDKLCRASIHEAEHPAVQLMWPDAFSEDSCFFTPELSSLHGTTILQQCTPLQIKELSFYEAVNFFSLNIHGEKSLIEGLAQRLYLDSGITRYLHHFLDEENKHMMYFGEFCMKYANKIYPDKKVRIDQEASEGEEEFLFFAKVLIFEEIVDVFNTEMAKDERLPEIIQSINLLHHRDESRHLVFGRRIVKELFEKFKDEWTVETLARIRGYLATYLLETWREYYNPQMYRDSGMDQAYGIYEQAFADPATIAARERISSGVVQYLMTNSILIEKPRMI